MITVTLGMPSEKKKKLSDICQNSNLPNPPYHIFDNFQFWQKLRKLLPPSLCQFGKIFDFSKRQILLILDGKNSPNSQICIKFSIMKSQY